jgi:peroxiredoxin
MEEEAMEQEVMSQPEIDHFLPPFELQSLDNRTVSPWDFKEKKDLLLLFFDPRNRSDLETLALIRRRYDEFADANAEILAIASGPRAEMEQCMSALKIPFTLLSDENDKVRNLYGVKETTIFAADRFGQLRLVKTVEENIDHILDIVIDALDLSELECPECGVSTWPSE